MVVILTTILLNFVTPVFSRSPAVEPVTGLDIEKYQHEGQTQDQARYDWVGTSNQQRVSHPSQALLENSSNDLIQNYLLTALMLLLPLSLWPIINKKIKKAEAFENRRRNEEASNIARIHDRRKSSQDESNDSDDDNFSKAS